MHIPRTTAPSASWLQGRRVLPFSSDGVHTSAHERLCRALRPASAVALLGVVTGYVWADGPGRFASGASVAALRMGSAGWRCPVCVRERPDRAVPVRLPEP